MKIEKYFFSLKIIKKFSWKFSRISAFILKFFVWLLVDEISVDKNKKGLCAEIKNAKDLKSIFFALYFLKSRKNDEPSKFLTERSENQYFQFSRYWFPFLLSRYDHFCLITICEKSLKDFLKSFYSLNYCEKYVKNQKS